MKMKDGYIHISKKQFHNTNIRTILDKDEFNKLIDMINYKNGVLQKNNNISIAPKKYSKTKL